MSDVNIKYVGKTALATFWSKIKTYMSGLYVPKTRKINGYDLSSDRDFFLGRTITLTPETWSQSAEGFTKEIAFECKGVDANDFVFVEPQADYIQTYYDCNVRCTDRGTDVLYFRADAEFSDDLKVNVLIVKVEGTEVSS